MSYTYSLSVGDIQPLKQSQSIIYTEFGYPSTLAKIFILNNTDAFVYSEDHHS